MTEELQEEVPMPQWLFLQAPVQKLWLWTRLSPKRKHLEKQSL
jgi:hypothetical protein